MGTEAAKLTYRLRGQTAEWVNGLCPQPRILVHAQQANRVVTIALLFAITHKSGCRETLASAVASVMIERLISKKGSK